LDTGSTYVIIHWDVAEISGYDPASSPEHGNITDYCLLSCHKPAISSANYPPVFETSLKTDAWFHGDQTVEHKHYNEIYGLVSEDFQTYTKPNNTMHRDSTEIRDCEVVAKTET